MIIKSAEFVCSSQNVLQCPKPNMPEYAFIGRSNVGKSSLINMLVGKKGLAKTSATPGKTQLINHFIINDQWYLVDLPGYGFAKVAQTKREEWLERSKQYLLKRKNLLYTFVLVDSRIPPQKIDIEFINWLGTEGIPLIILMTKTDKISGLKLQNQQEALRQVLLENWEQLPEIIATSAITQTGRETVLKIIEQTNPIFILPHNNTK